MSSFGSRVSIGVLSIMGLALLFQAFATTAAADDALLGRIDRLGNMTRAAAKEVTGLSRVARRLAGTPTLRRRTKSTHRLLRQLNKALLKLDVAVVPDAVRGAVSDSLIRLNSNVGDLDARASRVLKKTRLGSAAAKAGVLKHRRRELRTWSKALRRWNKALRTTVSKRRVSKRPVNKRPKPAAEPTASPTPRPTPTPSPTPTPTGPSGPPAGQYTSVVDYGANGADLLDDTAAINRTLAATGAGQTVYFPAGTYLASTITLPAGVNVAGDGGSYSWLKAKIYAGSNQTLTRMKLGGSNAYFTFSNPSSNIRFEDCVFAGPNSGSVASITVNNKRVTDVTFDSCRFAANDTNIISLYEEGTTSSHYENWVFAECVFEKSGRTTVEVLGRYGDPRRNTSGWRNISFYDCDFTLGERTTISYEGALLADGSGCASGWSTVRGCRFTATTPPTGAGGNGNTIEVNGPRDMTFDDNVFRTFKKDAVGVWGDEEMDGGVYRHIVITNNLIDNSAVAPAGTGWLERIVSLQGDDNVFSNNTIISNSEFGVEVYGARRNTITNNVFKTSGRYPGVAYVHLQVKNSSGNLIEGNTFTSEAGSPCAITAGASFNNLFTHNRWTNASASPLKIYAPATATLTENYFGPAN